MREWEYREFHLKMVTGLLKLVEVCKRRGLIVNAGKSKVMVMNG